MSYDGNAMYRSLSYPGCLLAALLEQHPGCKLTYDTNNLMLGQLMEWLRIRLAASRQAIQQHVTITPVLDMSTRDQPVGGVNWTVDFLYRGQLDIPDMRNEPRNMASYQFVTFYKKNNQARF